jgi:phosphoribosylformylglycinamidine synthase PurS subunit
MKKYQAIIDITLRKSILDVQGKAVEQALHSIEFPMITNVRIGKHVELFLEADNPEKAHNLVDDASKKLIANPIIEDYVITINEVK